MKKITWFLGLTVLLIVSRVQAQSPTSITRVENLSISLQKKLKLSEQQRQDLYKMLLTQAREEDDLKQKVNADKLAILRSKLDQVDYQILQSMAERMQIVQEIGHYKLKKHMRVLQPNRWQEVVNSRSAFAGSLGLNIHFTNNWLELIHKESLRRQLETIDQQDEYYLRNKVAKR